ncbi:hypothetical protein H7F15_12860 [Pontibacter sp. Tf4]|uniref:hypothetical protein n=1 Tax=Pontibacter sp. Tf4 TaxID=2761620 RepID=UPI00162387A5|nr:hypothetical protein [Pontibacter sp. Tf4]MBB6611934.1 hypothetical protein [Pontibacter sp. Tf4]
MKIILTLFNLLFLSITSAYAQTDWQKKEKLLWESYEQKKISSEEWYQSLLIEAGSLGSELQVWLEQKTKADKSFLQTFQPVNADSLLLRIPNEWEVVKENGNSYVKLYMINLKSDTASIPRIDATINNFSDYIKIKGKWYQIRQNYKSDCGNSYYNSGLEPAGLYSLEVNSIHQNKGSEEVPYKVAFDYNGKRIESNEVKIRLYTNQWKRLVYEKVK